MIAQAGWTRGRFFPDGGLIPEVPVPCSGGGVGARTPRCSRPHRCRSGLPAATGRLVIAGVPGFHDINSGRFDEALELFEAQARADPGDLGSHRAIVSLMLRKKQIKEAEALA
jgi:hypothetical protein